MKIRALLLTAIASLAAIASGQPPVIVPNGPPAPQAPPKQPLVAFRTTLTIGDADRNWTYVNTRDENLTPSWKVNGTAYTPWLLPQVNVWYDPLHHGGYSLPATVTAPGVLTLDLGRGPEVTLSVVALPKRTTVTIPNGASADAVNKAFAPGNVEVILAPGEHVWSGPVVMYKNCVLRGYQATVRRTPITNYGTNWPSIIVAGPEVSVYGVTFVYNDTMPGGMVFMANPTQTGLVVAHCNFMNCNMGFFFTDSLVRDCDFYGGGAIICPTGMWLRCRFHGPSMMDPYQIWGSLKSVQMIDCIFDKTQRGPVMNGAWGPLNNCFFSGVMCYGINRGNNGNEIWLCEGGKVNNLLCFHSRVAQCESSVFQFDAGADNAYIRDFTMDGGLGVVWAPNAPAAITNCSILDFQFTRAGAYMGPGTSKCLLQDGLFIGFLPTRANQTFSNGSPLLFNRTTAVWAEGPLAATNLITRSPVLALSAGFTATAGFTAAQ